MSKKYEHLTANQSDKHHEKRRMLARIRRSAGDNSVNISIDDIIHHKNHELNIPEPEFPDFTSLVHKTDFYYFLRDKFELLLENTNGVIPRDIINLYVDELDKCWLMLMMDICGTKITAQGLFEYHKFNFDKKLKKANLYDYYSTRLGIKDEDRDIKI